MRQIFKIAQIGLCTEYSKYPHFTIDNKTYAFQYSNTSSIYQVKVKKDCNNYKKTQIPCCGTWENIPLQNKKLERIFRMLKRYYQERHETKCF